MSHDPYPMKRVDPTAVVSPDAQLGDDVRIWHFVHVDAGAVIGEMTSVGQGCYIGAVTIGKRCRIQNNISLYRGVTIDDDVFLGPSCVFTNVMHPRAHVSRKLEFTVTVVGRGASIGANATIVCGNRGIRIGEYAFVGAGAVVTHDVEAHALVVGVPARQVGWVCRCGERLLGESALACSRCADRYQAVDGSLARL
jgi:UDP-2-acetamido-3-amino-2,3-dideoxy-glucuronate N-acetyltransferase